MPGFITNLTRSAVVANVVGPALTDNYTPATLPAPPAPVLTTIIVTPGAVSNQVGDVRQWVALGYDQSNTLMEPQPTFTWGSSATAVATVDSTGLVTCVALGTCSITATSGAISASASMTVSAAPSGGGSFTGALGVFNFTGGLRAATGVATGLTFGDLTRNASASATYNSATSSPGTSTDPVLSIESSATTAATAFTNGRYDAFTVTVASGYTLSVSSITLKTARAGTSTARGFAFRHSVDSYTATLGDQAVTESGTTLALKTIDLSAVTGLQNLGPGTYTFRMGVYTGGSGLALRFDDITLNGTVAQGTGGGGDGGGGGGTTTTGTDPVFTAEPAGYTISYTQQFTPAFINSVGGNGTGWGKGFSGDVVTDQEALTCPWQPSGSPGIARLMLRAGTTPGQGNSPSGGFDAAVPYLPNPAAHRFQKSYTCSWLYVSPNWINHPVETKLPPLTWPCGKFHVYPALVGSGNSSSGTMNLDLVLQSMDWRTAGTAKRYATNHPVINRGQWYKLQLHVWQPTDIITPSSDGRVVLYLDDTLIYDTGFTMPLAKNPPDASTYMFEYQMKMTYGGAGLITMPADQWLSMAGLRVSGSLTL